MRYPMRIGLVLVFLAQSSHSLAENWTPPPRISPAEIRRASDAVLAMPDIDLEINLDILRIRVLEMDWDIAGRSLPTQRSFPDPDRPGWTQTGSFSPAWRIQ